MTPESIQSKTICNDVWILDREPVVINAINEVRKNCIQTKSFLNASIPVEGDAQVRLNIFNGWTREEHMRFC